MVERVLEGRGRDGVGGSEGGLDLDDSLSDTERWGGFDELKVSKVVKESELQRKEMEEGGREDEAHFSQT